jgi:hypothetical protein
MPVVNQKKIVSLAQARKNLEGKGIKITKNMQKEEIKIVKRVINIAVL